MPYKYNIIKNKRKLINSFVYYYLIPVKLFYTKTKMQVLVIRVRKATISYMNQVKEKFIVIKSRTNRREDKYSDMRIPIRGPFLN